MKSKKSLWRVPVLVVVVILAALLSACGENGAGGEVSQQDAAEAFALAFGAYGEALMTIDGATGDDTTANCSFSWTFDEDGEDYSFSLTMNCTDPGSGITIVGIMSGSFDSSENRSEVLGDFAISGAYTATMSFSFVVQGDGDAATYSGSITVNGTTYSFDELLAGG